MKNKKGTNKIFQQVPLFLSALVFPGLGQFVQKRYLMGAIYLISFATMLTKFMLVAVKLIISYYRMGFEFETYEPPEIHLGKMLITFAIAMIIYILNLIDTAVAQFVLSRKKIKSPWPPEEEEDESQPLDEQKKGDSEESP